MQTIESSGKLEYEVDPVTNFLFALRASETKRQYPKRLEIFLDFLGIQGKFED